MGNQRDFYVLPDLSEVVVQLLAARIVLYNFKSSAIFKRSQRQSLAPFVLPGGGARASLHKNLIDHQNYCTRLQPRGKMRKEFPSPLFADVRPPQMRHAGIEL